MKARDWSKAFSEMDPDQAILSFVNETVSLADSRGKSDAAVESAVREQKDKLRAAGLEPSDLDGWLEATNPELYEKYKRGHYRLKGWTAIRKCGLTGKPARQAPRTRRQKAGV